MNNVPCEKLKYIITQYGRSISEDPKRCEALLRDLCGQYRKEINVLVSAAKEGIPADLSNSQNTVSSDLLLSRLTKRLEDRLGLTQESAKWAVESWAIALGIVAERDKRVTEPSSSPSQNSVLPPINKRVKTPSIPIDRRNFFKWMGFGGIGVVSAWLLNRVFGNLPITEIILPTAEVLSQAGTPPKLTKIQFTSIKLDSRGETIDLPSGNAEIFTEDLGSGVKLTMVKIPAGKFLMGSPLSEEKRESDESPQHQVNVPEFFIGQTLVTQSQWTAIMGSNPSQFRGNDKLPVDTVSWLDAMDFCQKLSQKTRRTYLLPSEAEWEYACRAGTTNPFAFGETIRPDVVNYNGNYPYQGAAKGKYRKKTTPVGTFPPNLFGLYDIHGNLFEWCLDEWVDSYQGAPNDGSARGDINSRDENKLRLLRGGFWFNGAPHCRSANRDNNAASYSQYNIGVRVVSVPSRTS